MKEFIIVNGLIFCVSTLIYVLLMVNLIGTEKETPKICIILLIVMIISGFIATISAISYI